MSTLTTSDHEVSARPSVSAEIPAAWVRLDEEPLVAMLIDAVHDMQRRVSELEKRIGGCP